MIYKVVQIGKIMKKNLQMKKPSLYDLNTYKD